jgi:hypothetical protein
LVELIQACSGSVNRKTVCMSLLRL